MGSLVVVVQQQSVKIGLQQRRCPLRAAHPVPAISCIVPQSSDSSVRYDWPARRTVPAHVRGIAARVPA